MTDKESEDLISKVVENYEGLLTETISKSNAKFKKKKIVNLCIFLLKLLVATFLCSYCIAKSEGDPVIMVIVVLSFFAYCDVSSLKLDILDEKAHKERKDRIEDVQEFIKTEATKDIEKILKEQSNEK